jgi:predicted DCC family thiol-disulfide oxidoreductase YuxK
MQPAEYTARLLVFDGLCNLCSGWARFLERHPVDPPFQLIPMQSMIGKTLLADNGIDPDLPVTFLVLDQGRRWTQSDAAMHVIAALGGPWRAINVLRVVPQPWRDYLYQLLARNRYRWFGRRSTCYLPR